MNSTSTQLNFGALRINKGAEKALKKLPKESLDNLRNIGNDLKDVKRFDFVVDKDLKVTIERNGDKKREDWLKPLNEEMRYAGKFFNKADGDKAYQNCFSVIPNSFAHYCKGNVVEKYSKFEKLNKLDQAVEYSKMLDSHYADLEKKLIKTIERQRENPNCQYTPRTRSYQVAVNEKVKSLLNSFGTDN